jgi:hypothetical protein
MNVVLSLCGLAYDTSYVRTLTTLVTRSIAINTEEIFRVRQFHSETIYNYVRRLQEMRSILSNKRTRRHVLTEE